jgi:hypothetical protein
MLGPAKKNLCRPVFFLPVPRHCQAKTAWRSSASSSIGQEVALSGTKLRLTLRTSHTRSARFPGVSSRFVTTPAREAQRGLVRSLRD